MSHSRLTYQWITEWDSGLESSGVTCCSKILVTGACRLYGILIHGTRAAQTAQPHGIHAATHRDGKEGVVVGTRG